MANWNGLILTDLGRDLQAKVEAGTTLLKLTKFKLGNGTISGSQTLEGLTGLVSPKQIIGITTCTPKENGLCTITGTVTNTGLKQGYELKELGIFAENPNGGELLYAVTIDTHPDYLQAEGGATVVSEEFNLNIAISNTATVTAVIDVTGLATINNVQTLVNQHDNDKNAHKKVLTDHNTDQSAHTNIINAHNTDTAAHANGIAGNAATATRLKPALNGSRNQCWLLCKLPKAATALVHYEILGAQYYDQYSTLEVVIKNGFGWCKYVGTNTNWQVYVRAYDTGTSIDVYLFAPGYCDFWELFLQKNGAATEFSYKKMGDATYVPTGTLVCDTVTGLGMDGVELFNAKSSTGESIGHIGFTISNIPEGCLILDTGALVSRATYPQLWGFVQSSRNLLPTVTDAQWQTMADNQTSVAAFSTGDDSTTFRLPKLLGWAKGGTQADVGDTQEAGLPNITGSMAYIAADVNNAPVVGALSWGQQNNTTNPKASGSGRVSADITLNASKSNAIYGASTEVEPAGFVGVYYIRAFHGTTNQGNIDITALANEKADVNLSNINDAGKQTILDSVISSGDGYIKFADGTMIQQGESAYIDVGANNGIAYTYQDVTFPISFSTTPNVIATMGTKTTTKCSVAVSNTSIAGFQALFMEWDSTVIQLVSCRYIAIGRWK